MSELSDLMTVVEFAYNPHPAWGYAPEVTAEKLADGRVRISAYALEGDWFERVCAAKEADAILFTDPEGNWPGAGCWMSEREYVRPLLSGNAVVGWQYGAVRCPCSPGRRHRVDKVDVGGTDDGGA